MSTKGRTRFISFIYLLVLLLASCSPGTASLVPPTDTVSQAPPTLTPEIIPSETSLPATATRIPATATSNPEPSLEPPGYPLAENGPYYVGRRNYELVDASRGGRPVSIIVWYPALLLEGSKGTIPMREAEPDFSGAPYPVILSDTMAAGKFVQTLVSHGFTWVSVSKIDTYDPWDENLFLQPLDQLFALDQVSTNPPQGLEGMLDTDRVGTTGYSFGGYNALALGGPRIDPAFYLDVCADEEAAKSSPIRFWDYVCAPAARWDDFSAAAGPRLTQSEDGLWQPMTDPRIRVVVPLAGEGWWLYGEQGLASANRPTLIIAATNDGLYQENAWIYKQIKTEDKAMISFIGPGHMMIYEPDMIARMAHFMTAFFGVHLQGREDLAWYYSEDFVRQHEDLAWGVYESQ